MASKAPDISGQTADNKRGPDDSLGLLIVSAIFGVLAVASLVV